MAQASYEQLHKIKDFDGLLEYLRDVLDWPIDSFDVDEIFFEYEPEELGLDESVADGIESIRQLRSMEGEDTLGIFFVEFKKKKLPMVAMRRLLRSLVIKKRASSQSADRVAFKMRDLLFISQYGEGERRKISFAQFSDATPGNLPPLKVLAWGETQTKLTLQDVDEKLRRHLKWPDDPTDSEQWHGQMAAAFTLRHGHVIKTSKELATHLAELAKAIYEKAVEALDHEIESGPLTKLLRAFQQALIQDLTPDSFADMYAQTITYGLFSAAVSSYAGDPKYNGRSEVTTEKMVKLVPNTNPFLREMLSTFLSAGGEGNALNFDELGINDVVDLLNDEKTDIHSVIREFGAARRDEDPVIHFYEDFLKAYNSKLRFDRGVFYTPKPVVSYIVRSVHELLQTEFGLEDGLADTTSWGEMVERYKGNCLEIPKGMRPQDAFVQILDPATGTATFLVEVIDIVHKTMMAKWKEGGKNETQCVDAWNEYVPTNLLPRVYGFELMMAPYAIAHMKIGLKLTETGYRFCSEERARIFLTNALDKDPKDIQSTLGDWFPALAKEASVVGEIKKRQKFSVVVGNPPYSLYSANMTEAASAFIKPFRFVDGVKVTERGALQLEKNLQDDYVKFFGLVSSSILQTNCGIVGFVTNHGYINNRTLRGLRFQFLRTFDCIRVLDLHGSASRSSAESSALQDGNVFDIQQGVAVGLFTRNPSVEKNISYDQILAPRERKYRTLSNTTALTTKWKTHTPQPPLFLFEPRDESLSKYYESGVSLAEIFPLNSTGIVTARDKLVVQMDKSAVELITDEIVSLDIESAREKFGLGKDTKDWALPRAKQDLVKAKQNGVEPVQILYRPFDFRWTLYTGQARGFMCNPRRPTMSCMTQQQNLAICVNRQVNSTFQHVGVTRGLISDCTLSTATKERTYILPLYLADEVGSLLKGEAVPNIGDDFYQRIADVSAGKPTPEAILYYCFAILHSPTYRTRYAQFLRSDFPRIPIPELKATFDELVQIGESLVNVQLLNVLTPTTDVSFFGENAVVEKVSWENDTVFLDTGKTSGFKAVGEVLR